MRGSPSRLWSYPTGPCPGLVKPFLAFLLGQCAYLYVRVGVVVLSHGREQATHHLGNLVIWSGVERGFIPSGLGGGEEASPDLKPSAPDSREREKLQLQRGICGEDQVRKSLSLSPSKNQRNTLRNVNFQSGNTSFPLWVIVFIQILESTVLCCMFPHLAYLEYVKLTMH